MLCRYFQSCSFEITDSVSHKVKLVQLICKIFIPGMNYSANKRANYVYFSPSSSHTNECFFQPEKWKCHSLSFILQTIIQKELFWIETIYAKENSSTKVELYLKNEVFQSNRKLKVECLSLHKCIFFSNQFHISAKYFNRHLKIFFKNVKFVDTTLTIQNLDITFDNVLFVNTVIGDKQALPGLSGEICLTFLQSSFETCEFKFDDVFIALFVFQNTEIYFCAVNMKGTNLWLNVLNSFFSDSFISLDIKWLFHSSFDNVIFTGGITAHQNKQAVLEICAEKLDLFVSRTTIQNSFGALTVTKRNSGLLQSWLKFSISDSYFINNTKLGSGGAVHILFISQKHPQSSHSIFRVVNCSFIDNSVQRRDFKGSFGGAIFIQSVSSEADSEENQEMYVFAFGSTFVNNDAREDGGGAIYASHGKTHLSVENCTFIFNSSIIEGGLANGVFVLTYSTTVVVGSIFLFLSQYPHESPSLLQFLSETSISEIEIVIQCLPWHTISHRSKFGVSRLSAMSVLQEASFHCEPCPQSYYVPTQGQYSISYSDLSTRIQVAPINTGRDSLNCSACPAGAYCPGNLLVAKPNFWGFYSKDGVLFQQCPVGYCCVRSARNPCLGYNLCSGSREGTLCGSCQKDYSLSLLSHNCIGNDLCFAHWIWAPTFLAALLYMIWYTFKDNILAFIGSVRKCLICKSIPEGKDNTDKGYFGILIYFVQVTAVIRLPLIKDHIRTVDSLFQSIESYFGLFLSFELSNISFDVCSGRGTTTTNKTGYKFAFLVGIYLCWGMTFVGSKLLFGMCTFYSPKIRAHKIDMMKAILINGLVEIIKYSYGGFTSLVFYSVTCVTVFDKYVWFYDGSVECFSLWQYCMISVCVAYVVPFPLMLYLGMRLLKNRIISANVFLLGCFFPLPLLVCWARMFFKFKTHAPVSVFKAVATNHDNTIEMFDRFRGAYKLGEKGEEYWECIMILRRLLLSSTILIPNPITQLSTSLALCILFFGHHLCVYPFISVQSNKVESLSLFLLCAVSGFNLIKATYIHLGISPDISDTNLINNLGFAESMFLPFLFVFCVTNEMYHHIKTKGSF